MCGEGGVCAKGACMAKGGMHGKEGGMHGMNCVVSTFSTNNFRGFSY